MSYHQTDDKETNLLENLESLAQARTGFQLDASQVLDDKDRWEKPRAQHAHRHSSRMWGPAPRLRHIRNMGHIAAQLRRALRAP